MRTIAIPFTELPSLGYLPQRIDCNLSGAQAKALRDLRETLMAEGTALQSGKVVRTIGDAARYVFERIAAAPDDADLATVANAWPQLDAPTKASILDLL